MLALHTLAVALSIVAALVYVAFLYQSRGLPDAREVSAVVSWVLFALVLLVVVQTMAACPAEHRGIKGLYVLVVLVLLANAAVEVSAGEAEKKRFSGLTWVSVVLALLVTLVAANRSSCWERTGRVLTAVKAEYSTIPGPDRVAVAEDVLEASAAKPRVMKQMLRTLERAARRSGSRSKRM
jgi:hypothetical protein